MYCIITNSLRRPNLLKRDLRYERLFSRCLRSDHCVLSWIPEWWSGRALLCTYNVLWTRMLPTRLVVRMQWHGVLSTGSELWLLNPTGGSRKNLF